VSEHDDQRFSEEPYRSVFGRVTALKARREEFYGEVEAGAFDLAELFAAADSEPAIGTAKVLGLIEAIPDFGKVQTRRAFGDLGISEAAHIDDVTTEQRAGLPAALVKHAR